jgi:hypothetical protein
MHDPQPGDFDAELETLRPYEIQHIDASPGAQLAIQVMVRGDDVDSLERLALERGEQMSDVVSSLIRDASRSVAGRRAEA